MTYILTLDQGTTSSRSLIFDKHGKCVACAQQEFRQHFPHPGYVEHDPMEIWQSQLAVAQAALRNANLQASDIAAIGITNQRETTLVWNRLTGKPIYNAIVWQDRRTAIRCDELKQRGYESLIQKKTGLLLDPYFSATKVQWMLENVQGARQQAQAGELAFGTIDSWLVWNLTGGKHHITDATNASRTLLYDIHQRRWDEELLRLFNIPESMMPQVCASSGNLAETTEGIFSSPIPIAGLIGDQQAALFGQRCRKRGMVKCTYGTGCFMLMNTGEKAVVSTKRLLTTIAWQIGDHVEYALEGSVFVGGGRYPMVAR